MNIFVVLLNFLALLAYTLKWLKTRSLPLQERRKHKDV